MGKLFIFLFFAALLALGGYAVSKSLPYFQSQFSRGQLNTPTPNPTPSPPPDLSETTQTINAYLAANIALATNSGRVTCVHRLLISHSDNPEVYYVWALCQEYYQSGTTVAVGAGISLPLSLTIKTSDDQIQVISHQAPRAGADYATDLKAIFPVDSTYRQVSQPDPQMLEDLQRQVDLAKPSAF